MKTKFLFLSSAFLFLAFELSARTVVSLDGDCNGPLLYDAAHASRHYGIIYGDEM